MAAAGFLKTPELALEEAEAKNLAEAVKGVADQYTYHVDPRTVAWGNLLMVCGMVYGPRMMAIYNGREKTAKRQPAPTPINQPTQSGRVNGAPAPAPITNPSQMYGGDFGVTD